MKIKSVALAFTLLSATPALAQADLVSDFSSAVGSDSNACQHMVKRYFQAGQENMYTVIDANQCGWDLSKEGASDAAQEMPRRILVLSCSHMRHVKDIYVGSLALCSGIY